MPDISEPVRDRGHEALRLELLAAIEGVQNNTSGVEDSYFLTDILFDLLDGALAQVDALNIRCDALQIRCDTAQDDIDAMQTAIANLTPGV